MKLSSPLHSRLLAVLLVLAAALVNAQDEFACATADETADCIECLTEGCVFTVGQCLSTCSVIADVACWDMQYHPNKTVEEVCQTKETMEADETICGAPELQSDCGNCTSTPRTEPGTVCSWYEIPNGGPGYCGAGGCGFDGVCGSTLCQGDNGTQPELFNDQEEEEPFHPCNGFDLCEPCLNSRIECAWIADSCQPSCDVIADAACYHPANFRNLTGPEICKIAQEATEQVFDDADQDQDEDYHPCNGFEYCEPCLNSRIECAFVGGNCEPSCDGVDGTCYHPAEFNLTGPEICAIAVEAGDAKLSPTSDEKEEMPTTTDGDGDSDSQGEEGLDGNEDISVERDIGGPQTLESAASSRLVAQIGVAMAIGVAAIGCL